MSPNEIPLWITATQWIARLILVLLVILSVWSVATMIKCYRLLQEAAGRDEDQNLFEKFKALAQEGKLSTLIAAAGGKSLYHEMVRAICSVSQEALQIDRSAKSILVLKRGQVERGLTILGTLGSNAPFIGLFGTVLGIIQAFGVLGSQQGNSAGVMAGISEALVATAVGLFVAIPAVVAFNFLSRELRQLMTNCESLRDIYISKMK